MNLPKKKQKKKNALKSAYDNIFIKANIKLRYNGLCFSPPTKTEVVAQTSKVSYKYMYIPMIQLTFLLKWI